MPIWKVTAINHEGEEAKPIHGNLESFDIGTKVIGIRQSGNRVKLAVPGSATWLDCELVETPEERATREAFEKAQEQVDQAKDELEEKRRQKLEQEEAERKERAARNLEEAEREYRELADRVEFDDVPIKEVDKRFREIAERWGLMENDRVRFEEIVRERMPIPPWLRCGGGPQSEPAPDPPPDPPPAFVCDACGSADEVEESGTFLLCRAHRATAPENGPGEAAPPDVLTSPDDPVNAVAPSKSPGSDEIHGEEDSPPVNDDGMPF